MALVGPTATEQDVDHYVSVIAGLVDALVK
jgi:hypothetical protein